MSESSFEERGAGTSNLPSSGCRPFTFFGGKGGTGKTTCAAAYACHLSSRGCRTLLVSTDPAHSTSDVLEVQLGADITPVAENLWGLEVDPALEARRYISAIQERMLSIVSPAIVDEIKKQMEIAYTSPGAEEAAIFDKFVELMDERGRAYDAIVFDTAPTGHTLRLLSLPEILGGWIENLIAKRRKAMEMFGMAGRFDEEMRRRAEGGPRRRCPCAAARPFRAKSALPDGSRVLGVLLRAQCGEDADSGDGARRGDADEVRDRRGGCRGQPGDSGGRGRVLPRTAGGAEGVSGGYRGAFRPPAPHRASTAPQDGRPGHGPD